MKPKKEYRDKVYADLESIFLAAVERVDPYSMLKNHVMLEGDTLKVQFEGEKLFFSLGQFANLYVIGAGKATAKMAKAVEEIFSGKITSGAISVKYGHTETGHLSRIATTEAGHPVPDENSIRASQEIEKIAAKADDKTLVINLVSGGGSALLTSPLSCHIDGESVQLSLHDLQLTNKALLASGAPIQEMNCIRKHLSNIKGGRLARLLYPATVISFILSDVVGDRLDSIASGLTAYDETSYQDALAIVDRYGLRGKLPPAVARVLQAGAVGKIEETPKMGDRVLSRVDNILIGTNYTALQAASKRAQDLGYHTTILSSQIVGEAREVAKIFLGIARDIKKHDLLTRKPACVIGGGETTVTLQGKGKGGRNQEMALSFVVESEKSHESTGGIYFLAASTDGNDGPTDAAGAFASFDVVELCKKRSLNPAGYLLNNDSYTFFDKTGYLFKTGPTNTNVSDVQVLLIR